MSQARHDLVHEPVITVRHRDGRLRTLTLPGLLASLSGGDAVVAFPALQAHQQHAWHAFLCQLAAIALHNAGESAPSTSEDAWAQWLLRLTGNRTEPWTLFVPDLAAPAFLQPPVPEGSLAGFKKEPVRTPDALDVLVTSKNHDLKSARIIDPQPDHWVFALVSLQTMQGFSGRDNYGIARMKSGFGSRPGVGYAESTAPAPRFRRDLKVLVENRAGLVDGDWGYARDGGTALLWLEPWSGANAIPIHDCDPYFIEVCRRIRLELRDGSIEARTAPSQSRRIAAVVDSGNTGDPWTPIARKDGTALTISDAGFSYRKVQELLFEGEYQSGTAGVLRDDDSERVVFIATALARGQGKTAGLHRRVLPLPGHVRHRLGRMQERHRMASLAKERVEHVALMDRKVLHPALCALLQGGPEKLDLTDRRTRAWRSGFDAEVDRCFFAHLWQDLDLPPQDASRSWAGLIRDLGRRQLEEAIHSAPVPDARRYRAISSAERVFEGAFRRNLGFASESHETPEVT